MNKKQHLVFITIVCFCLNTKAQKKYDNYFGVVYSASKTVSDVHIINLTSKIGTISNTNGAFEITASAGDVLLFSSIQFKPLKVKITQAYIPSKKLIINLKPNINKLDEVFLNGFTGDLKYDLANKPKDTIPKHSFVLNRNEVRKLGPDYAINYSKPPDAEALTNPILMNGVGASVTIPDKKIEAERMLKNKLKKNLSFLIN